MSLGISRKQLAMVAVLLAGTFIAVLNATLLTPALPTIMRDLNVESTTVQWLTSGYALTEAVVIPLSAYLMGRLSTRQIYIGGIACFGIGSLIAALSPSFPVLLLGRVIQAASTGAVMPMVMSTILLVFPREKRGSAMGVIGLLIGFAPAIGPSLSGVLIDTVGWRAIFVIVTVLSFAAVIIACAVLVNNSNFKRSKFDLLSVVLSTVGLVSLLYGFSTFSSARNHLVTAALVAVGVVGLGLYAHRQLTLDEPMLRVGILKNGRYRTTVIIVMIFMAALIGMETLMPLYIQGILGQPATVSGLTLLPGAVIGAIIGYFAGHIFDRYGVRKPVLAGGVAILIAAFGLTQLRADSPIVLVAVVYTVLAVGMQFTMTPVNTWGVNALPNSDIQHQPSTSNTLNQVAGSFGTALIISISAMVTASLGGGSTPENVFAGYHASFSTTAALVTLAVLLIVVFVRDKKTRGSVKIAVEQITPAEIGAVTVSQAMNRDAAKALNTASMREVVALMSSTDTTGVSVVSNEGELVGYVTDGDVARYLARHDQSYSSPSAGLVGLISDEGNMKERLQALAELNVMELATKRVITVDVNTPLDKACTVLSERKIKKVPVLEDGVLVGALSRRNVMRYMMAALAE